jgi:hypothetical protein
MMYGAYGGPPGSLPPPPRSNELWEIMEPRKIIMPDMMHRDRKVVADADFIAGDYT